MKKLMLTAALSMGLAASALAAPRRAGDMGLGVMLGNPTGITGKYFVTNWTALDLAVGSDDGLSFHGDVLVHGWDVFPKPEYGTFAGYMGVGAGFRDDNDKNDHDQARVRVPFGLAYYPPRNLFEIFLELVPALKFGHDTDFDLDAGVGFRFYIGSTGGRSRR